MEKTDAKVRLFLELSNQHPIQILNYIPLKDYKDWTPEKMYEHPRSQYYYAFINDIELISRIKHLITLNYNDFSNIKLEVDSIREELIDSKISLEFNGCNIENFDDLEKNKKNIPIINEANEENNVNNANIINNTEEERYVVFCRFFPKNFGFIHSYEKLNKDDINKLLEKPIVYALKGRIKTLLNIRRKEFESKKGDSDIGNVSSTEEDKGHIDLQKKDMGDKNNIISRGIDGHWFLINSYENLDFLSLIKYKEKLIIQPDQDKMNASTVSSNNTSVLSNVNVVSKTGIQKYTNPHIFSYIIKDTKKFVTVYQNKSCRFHHNKNEFICKDCNDFCCLECFEEKAKNNIHLGHKISLLDEISAKFEDDAKFLDERIQYLKSIIENEINDKKNEIAATKLKNEQTVNAINSENDNIRAVIKKQQIERAKVLGFLGNEALRILNDFNLKLRYIKILNDKGDMNTYLTNYFFFVKFYKAEIRKNLEVLKKKISATDERFNEYNDKLINLVEELKKTI